MRRFKKLSLQKKIFINMLFFTILSVILVWFFQIVNLDSFYKRIKIKELSRAAETAKAVAFESDAIAALDEIAVKYDINIYLCRTNSSLVYSSQYNQYIANMYLPKEDFLIIYNNLLANNGHLIINFFGSNNNTFPQMPLRSFPGDEESQKFLDSLSSRGIESMAQAELLNYNGSEYVLFLTSTLTPVGATVNTLKIQLVYITIIMILISLVLSYLLSRTLAKPLSKLTDSAKELAAGNLDADFKAEGFKEVNELSSTLEYASGELKKTETFREELIANVSHDLRTPLTMIISYAEMMKDLPGENSPENLQVIIDESARLTNLVNDMLDVSKLQAGVIKLDCSNFCLTEQIKDILTRFKKLTEVEGYILNFNYDEEVYIHGDEFKMTQVIYNLVNNAINYTGEDKTVTISQTVNNEDNTVTIRVSDTGAGIEADVIPYVWDRYYKLDKTHKRAKQGTGLGLSIVKNILELHSANYGVESTPGEGTTFWFTISLVY